APHGRARRDPAPRRDPAARRARPGPAGGTALVMGAGLQGRALRRAAPGRAGRRGRVVSDLTTAARAAGVRVKACEDKGLHAFYEWSEEAMLAQAGAAVADGSLAGQGVAIKANIADAHYSTSCGSRILEGWRSPFEATAVRRLRQAGAFIAGKTVCDEFAMGSSTEHSAFGPARNPHDPARVPGGSSGGSAV